MDANATIRIYNQLGNSENHTFVILYIIVIQIKLSNSEMAISSHRNYPLIVLSSLLTLWHDLNVNLNPYACYDTLITKILHFSIINIC
jgi:hypothetical protein